MRLLAGVVVLVAIVVVPASAARAWSKPPQTGLRRFAVIVSANDGGPGRIPLRFAESDASSVADVLRRLGGLRDDDLILLTGARRASLQSAFERMRAAIARAAGSGRRELIVYYAGHSDEEGLLLGGERVSYPELRQWLDGVGAEVRIAILDSCASGALIRLRGGALRPSFLQDAATNARGHAFLTSSSADESAQESDRLGSAFFTHYLLSGLRGAADTSRDGLVTLAEAYQFAFHETLGRTERSGAGPQHPAYDIQLAGTGDLVLTDLRATGASLIVDEKIAGRLYVRDGAGRLLVELRKEPVYPVQLGLGAGTYRVTVDADGRLFETQVSLEDGKSARLGPADLVPAPAVPVVARGDATTLPLDREARRAPPPAVAAAVGPEHGSAWGAYAGLALGWGHILGVGTLFEGGEAGVVFQRRLMLGLGLMGGNLETWNTGLAVIGAVVRFRFLSESQFFDLTIGGRGGVGRFSSGGTMLGPYDTFVEPQLTGGWNLTRWLRLSADVGYRLAPSPGAIEGWTAGGQLQFGWF